MCKPNDEDDGDDYDAVTDSDNDEKYEWMTPNQSPPECLSFSLSISTMGLRKKNSDVNFIFGGERACSATRV